MSSKIIENAELFIANTYKRFPVVFTKGSECTLWDSEGNSYIDFVSGIAVCNLGHAHPKIAKALCEQAKSLLHVSNLYYTVPQVELASWLVKNSFADKVFFCNSGAEANEAAIKLARKYAKEKMDGKFKIVAMDNSFHGRTMATLSATGQEKIKIGFDPVLEGFDFAPFNDIEAIRKKIGPATCAVLVEPIQGEGGVKCPDEKYFKALREICDKIGILLIFDEIQTGMGRTGKLFAYEHYGVEPDIMTLAKALGNGLPIGAMLAKESVAQAFGHGSHASTFGGTPIVTAASLSVAEIFEKDNIVEACRETGEYFKEKLLHLKQKKETIIDVRGKGLLLGMKLGIEGEPIVKECMEKGFLINCVQGNILRFIPPLIIKMDEIDALIKCLDKIL
ncbi:MAG: aspartate aminotransferase family protein [Deltaproteobacteria bacterium]|nr:aspartate aminotransferase family protein [Deltaproteobacteria bacterium]